MPLTLLAPTPGRWLWTCRATFEGHLYEELAWQGVEPRLLGPGLVESDEAKTPPVFARVGFPVRKVASSVNEIWLPTPAAAPQGFHLQVWAPDTDVGNRLGNLAQTVESAIKLPAHHLADAATALKHGALLFQVCLIDERCWAIGELRARDALSLSPGGRHRMRREREAPSRAAMKLEEALDWLGVSPGKGEDCVDLGAAPGGWTQRLVVRGAKVLAIDPANLTPELEKHPKVEHIKASAFAFEPEEPVEWLFCDMAWRPLEVAQLLGKWGRRKMATVMVANFKLPMNDKNAMLWRIRHVLSEGSWEQVKMRQLYHDRDEVTVTAVVRK
jgi:23S rRNA (cytidine2498-2'-O)-methyltransferase